jgi:anti-sigma factor RsiW
VRPPPATVSAFRSSRPELAIPLPPPCGDDPRAARAAACAATDTQADAWLDGELAAGATATLEAHLRACPPCRAHVAALRRLVAAVRRQREDRSPAPASLRARVQALAARWHLNDAGPVDAAPGCAGRARPPAPPAPGRRSR